MRIAGSASYLRNRARRRAATAIALVVTGTLLLFVAFLASQSPGRTIAGGFVSFLAFGSLLVAWLLGLRARDDVAAAAVEAPVIAQLQARLSDDYLYLRHVALRNTEADAVLLGPHGALVLAICALRGRYTVRGNDWLEDDAAGALQPIRESPTWTLARPVRAVQRIVDEHGLGKVPVHGAVVLVQGELRDADRPALAVVPVSRIASYVEYLRPADSEPLREPVTHLAELLTPAARGGSATAADATPADVPR